MKLLGKLLKLKDPLPSLRQVDDDDVSTHWSKDDEPELRVQMTRRMILMRVSDIYLGTLFLSYALMECSENTTYILVGVPCVCVFLMFLFGYL